jgi:limonene-1,2-epoxide hydrolase
MHPFRAAIEARDIEAAVALLAEDVEFRSPVVFTPYQGREATATILRAVIEVFEDFRYVREVNGNTDHVLVFRARVGTREVEGLDFLHHNEAGQVDELMVMIRPLNGVLAVAEAMRQRLAAG